MEAGFLTPSDRYRAHTLVIGHGKKIKYGGCGGSVLGGVDPTVEAIGGGELEVGFLTPSDRYGAHTLVIGCGKEMKYGGLVQSVQSGVDPTVEAVGGGGT
jgi:hypothetical protein